MTLPGQQLYNGISSYLFGSNMAQEGWAQHTVRNNAQMQSLIKQGGFTIMRCSIVAGSSAAFIDQTASACANMGTAMLVILDHGNLAWNQHLVGYLGNRCMLYEFSNEPDLGGISWSQYLSLWNQHIPAMRAINPGAAYIGPVLGVFANLDSYFVPWLQGCKSSGVLPDAVSYHIYPCTGNYTASTCAPRATSFQSAAQKVDAAVSGVLGHTLPQALTEWNVDAANPVHNFALDPAFVPNWTKQAIDSMVAGGIAIACQWDAGSGAGGPGINGVSGADDLINTNTLQPNGNGQYQALVERIQHYTSGTPTPVPTPTPTPTPAPSGVTPLALSISNVASSVLPTANKLLITNSDTPPSAQSYTTFGTQTGFIEVFSQGGMAIAAGSISAPSGRGFILDPSDLNLAGQTIPAGAWSSIIRLNAAQTINHPQSGQLMADLYERMWKYNIVDKTYTHIATLWKAQEALTPAFTNYPLSMSNVPDVSFGENETLYIDAPANIAQNNNNNPQQGIRFNRLATTNVGDPFGTVTTPGYQPTVQPAPVPTPPTVTLNDTGLTPGTYEAVIDTTIGNKPTSIPITLTINS